MYETLGPGGGASFGNAGLVSVDNSIPFSLPGMAWQIPGWLAQRDSPLAIHAPHVLKAWPWLLAWLQAGRRQNVIAASQALRALHSYALKGYRDLLGDEVFESVIRRNGQLYIWSSAVMTSRADRLVADLRRAQNVAIEPMTGQAIRAMIPDLARHVIGGVRFPSNANTVNPSRLTGSLAERFRAIGGHILPRCVSRIQPNEKGFRLWTNRGDYHATKVVVAAGALSGELLQPLGVRIPLEAERGYHVQLPRPDVDVPLPFIYKDKATAVTPMENGLRFAGTVELAGLRHPPSERRIDAILATAKSLFPRINTKDASVWFGLRPSTPDSVPVIDNVPSIPGLYLACGHGHTGLTGSPMTGRVLTQLVTGVPSGIDVAPYRLSRF